MDWKKFFRASLAAEEAAKARYEQAAEAADVPAVKEAFKNLAYEEEMHYALLLQFEKDLDARVGDGK